MKMNKKIAALIFGATMMTGAVCSASVPDSDIAAGGIAPGSSLASAKSAYPDMTQRDHDTFVIRDGFVIDIDDKRPDVIEEIKIYTNNGVKTPKGIGVGSSEYALNDAYGAADKVDHDYDETEYVYYNANRTMKMKFEVVSGIITKITCELRD